MDPKGCEPLPLAKPFKGGVSVVVLEVFLLFMCAKVQLSEIAISLE